MMGGAISHAKNFAKNFAKNCRSKLGFGAGVSKRRTKIPKIRPKNFRLYQLDQQLQLVLFEEMVYHCFEP